jgi:hypothetical protein
MYVTTHKILRAFHATPSSNLASTIMKALLFFTSLSAVVASDVGCKGRLNYFDMVIPKDAGIAYARSVAIYFHWQRPQGLQGSRPGPINCNSNLFSSVAYVSDYLNTTYTGDTIYMEPMNYFESFYPIISNATATPTDVTKMKWHVSEFVADTKLGKIKSLVVDVLTEGSM